jgi:Flp pilus assembly protein TadG
MTRDAARTGWARRTGRRLEAGRGSELRRDDRGSVAVLMCYIVLLGGTLTGFVVDAGTNIDAANKADTYSSEAARAATIAIGPVPASGGTSTLQAAAAARAYLAQAGVPCANCVNAVGPATVTVTVTVTETTPILGVSISQTRTHTAQLQVGVTTGEGVS